MRITRDERNEEKEEREREDRFETKEDSSRHEWTAHRKFSLGTAWQDQR